MNVTVNVATKLRKQYGMHTVNMKKEYIVNSLNENSKAFWSYVNSGTKIKIGIGDLKDSNGDLKSDTMDKANILNYFFASVFTQEGTH